MVVARVIIFFAATTATEGFSNGLFPRRLLLRTNFVESPRIEPRSAPEKSSMKPHKNLEEIVTEYFRLFIVFGGTRLYEITVVYRNEVFALEFLYEVYGGKT